MTHPTEPAGLDRRRFLAAGATLAAAGALATAAARARARAAVVFVLPGGPSQLDTFDPKPSAPDAVRGPFRAARTRVPGLLFSELLPRTAARADRLTVVRALTADGAPDHAAALGALHAALCAGPGPPSAPPPLAPPDPRDTARYGDTDLGLQALASRRRVEAGAPLVVVTGTRAGVDAGFDAHTAAGMDELRHRAAPAFDRAFAALLDDLEARGLLGTTVVLAVGEFGRAPQLNPEGGRHHWTRCRSAVLAGGGFAGGATVGRSDCWGGEPDDEPLTAADLFGRVAEHLGRAPRGRP